MFATLTKRLGLEITQENFLVRAEQMRTLLQAYPSMIAANVIMVPLLILLMWGKVDHLLLLGWGGALYTFHALEIGRWLKYPERIERLEACKRWQRQFLLSDFLVGALWGSAGIFMFVPGEPLLQAFLLCILLGMAAGAVAGNLVFPLSQHIYVMLVILPITLNMFLQGGREYFVLATMVMVFLAFVLKTGRDQSLLFEKSILRGFENDKLVQALQQAQSRYHTLVDQASHLLFLHDMEGKILEVNRLSCEMLGYDRDELLWKGLEDVTPDFNLRLAQHRWKRLAPGVAQTFFSKHRRKDGSIFPVEVRLSCIQLDGQKRIMAFASDISERMRFESELKSSEERYRTFVENLPLGIVITQNGMIKYANRALSQMVGYPLLELKGYPFLPFIHAADQEWVARMHRQRMQGVATKDNYQVRLVRKDGQVRNWEMHISIIEWEGLPSALGIATDVTDRLEMESKLLESMRKLEDKELAKTRFLAAAGHDLRQPVAAANLFVDALKNTALDPQQTDLVTKLDQSMGVFSGLLERLLDISKFDAGRIKPKMVSYRLTELFNWLEQNFVESALERKLSFRFFIPLRQTIVLNTDIGLLQSVMMNLVSNAIKYTAQGGILVAARLRKDHVLLQVWDTGRGISEEDMSQVFDEFFQVENPQRNREAGLGLGLSICQRAMVVLGGRIGCCSTVGRGSVFEIAIPLAASSSLPQAIEGTSVTAKPIEKMFQSKRIVVLEDDMLVAEAMVSLLQGMGAEAVHFAEAETALRLPGIASADYYVVDFSLGGKLSGADFLHAVQQRATQPINGVLVTGETSLKFIEGISDLPWPVLHKPVNYAQLASALGN